MQAMISEFGRNEKALQDFKNLQQIIINKKIKAGRYSVHIDGNDEEAAKSLEVVTKDDVVIADEADEIWRCEKEYMRVWGPDWKQNEHQKGIFKGVKGIRVPGRQITRINNEKRRGTEMREHVADNKSDAMAVVEPNQIENMFAEMSQATALPAGTGLTSSDMPSAIPAALPLKKAWTEARTPTKAASSSSTPSWFGFMQDFVEPHESEGGDEEEDEEAAPSTRGKKPRGKGGKTPESKAVKNYRENESNWR